MDTQYIIVDLQQGSPEWHTWRSTGIGASDAPTIMGENPWKSPARLFSEKIGDVNPFASNAAMARGTDLEPEARKRYQSISKVHVVPACLQSKKYEWQIASVDGLAVDGELVVEIKCGDSVYQKTSSTRQVPGYYFGQLQHILAVTGFPYIDFFCYLPGLPEVNLRIERNDRYIKRLNIAEESFWNRILRHRQA
ncbi:MAG: hypothetical protein GX455_06955 [Phycisphaerae bacterium]|nr:hypothetical protein [Phycisphaerae bacterium]